MVKYTDFGGYNYPPTQVRNGITRLFQDRKIDGALALRLYDAVNVTAAAWVWTDEADRRAVRDRLKWAWHEEGRRANAPRLAAEAAERREVIGRWLDDLNARITAERAE